MNATRKPDFDNILAVCRRETPSRPTPFEFIICPEHLARLSGRTLNSRNSQWGNPEFWKLCAAGFAAAGYDFAAVHLSGFSFPTRSHAQAASKSLESEVMITDWPSFHAYPWPDPDAFPPDGLEAARSQLLPGMKLIVFGPGGVLENTMQLLGYQGMSYLLADDPELVAAVVDAVGQRLYRQYELALRHDSVGACITNDDWGFNTQTMLAPELMRRLIVPWHQKIVGLIHQAGRPAIMHSCGQLGAVMDDIIDSIGVDAKHSWEDGILPVEQGWRKYGSRIAVIGGIDLDFLCRSTPEMITRRCKAMLELSGGRGYALGSGNSIPAYVPFENYQAMLEITRDIR